MGQGVIYPRCAISHRLGGRSPVAESSPELDDRDPPGAPDFPLPVPISSGPIDPWMVRSTQIRRPGGGPTDRDSPRTGSDTACRTRVCFLPGELWSDGASGKPLGV